jgi:hypothetical protein
MSKWTNRFRAAAIFGPGSQVPITAKADRKVRLANKM